MDVTLEFSIALANGSPPHHARPPELRRHGGGTTTFPLSRVGTDFRATVAVTPGEAASFALSLGGQDYFDAEVLVTLLCYGPVPVPLTADPLIRRVTSRMDAGEPAYRVDVLAPRLRAVPGPGARVDPFHSVSDLGDEPLRGFAAPAGGAAAREPDDDSFTAVEDVAVDPWRVKYFEWKQGHPLIATYSPIRAIPTFGDYVVFFKPPKHNNATPREVVEAYLTADDTGFTGIAGAVEQSRTNATAVLLVGEAGNVPDSLVTADGIAALIVELDAWLRPGIPLVASDGLRSVALAAFSQGGEYLASTMRGVTSSRLGTLLKAVFVLDCYFPAGEDAFKRDLRTWYDAGPDRVVRSDWGFTVHRCDLFPGTPATAGERGTSSRTIRRGHPAGVASYQWVHFTQDFLRHRARTISDGSDLHHAIPKIFFPHALRTAGMARLP